MKIKQSYIPGVKRGYAWNGTVYLSSKWLNLYQKKNSDAEFLVFHLAVYAVQQRYFGKYRWIKMYIRDFLINLFTFPGTPSSAHHEVPFIKEARYWTATNGPSLRNLPYKSYVEDLFGKKLIFQTKKESTPESKFWMTLSLFVLAVTLIYVSSLLFLVFMP